ncbi:MAG: hypothetical protein RL385_4192, partial [Pseudomonadota bacterium]
METGPLPLSSVSVPNFSCRPLPPSSGDCRRDSDCGTGQACGLQTPNQTADRGPIGLRCGPPVGASPERTRCEAGTECESGLCALTGTCLAACAIDADCSAGQTCSAVEARVGAAGLAPVAACARSSAFPADVTLSLSDADITANRLNIVDVDSTAATNLYQLGASCDALIQVQGLYTLPDTASIFDIRELIAGDVSVNPVTNVGTIVPVLVPNNPDLPPSGSGYSLDVVSEQSTPLTVLLASRKRHGSLLDLNVFYAGGGEQLTPGGFHPGSSEISAFYKQLTSLYASAGITLGSIREYDVVGALRQELSVLETDVVLDESGNPIDISIAGLEDLFRLSAGVDDSGLNLFLVSDMGDVLGISGGIPGTLGLHGTAGSGVAIAVDVAGLADLPFVAQHELSHQMGLFHTT